MTRRIRVLIVDDHAVVRSGLYLDVRFLDQALSALTPTADERCGVLATDGTILCYQPSALLRLYQKNPKYLNRLYLHTVFHCIFRHLWLRGKRRQHHYRLQIRCEDRADMEQVLDLVNSTLHPAGLHPLQSLRPGRGDGRMLVLSLCCTPPQRRYLVQFVHQVGATRPVRWELRPDSDPPARH